MRRLMEMVANRRVDLTPLITHRFALDDVADAYEVFSQQRGGVLKVALHTSVERSEELLRTGAGASDAQC
jgi:threonine dehydrogenase-like Zn-dependent dehydrogenase